MVRWRYAAEAAAASELPAVAPRELGELSFHLEEEEGASGAARAPREIKPVTILSLDYREIKKIWLERHPDMTFATLGDLMDVKVAEGDEDLLVRTACGMDKVSAEHLRSPSLPPPPPPLFETLSLYHAPLLSPPPPPVGQGDCGRLFPGEVPAHQHL